MEEISGEVVWSSPPAQAGPSTVSCLGHCLMLGFGCRDFIYLSRSLKRTPDLLLWSWCIYILGFVSLYLCLLTFPFCCFEGDESTLLKSPSSSHLQSMYNVIIFLKLRAKAPNMSSWCCSCVVFMCAVTYVLF